MIEILNQRLGLANDMKGAEESFRGLQYDRYDPRFIDVGDPETIGMAEQAFDELSDGGYHILPASMDNHEWDYVGMRPCMLMVMAGPGMGDEDGRVYWYGYDKHGDASCRVETYSLSASDLREIAEQLNEWVQD